MVHELIKWVCFNGPRKREEANLWAVCRKVRMGHSKPKVMQAKKVMG